jgi:hypothetical protein
MEPAAESAQEVVEMAQERERDPRESLTSEQMSVIRMMAQGASIREAAVAHGMSEERVKGWDRTAWFHRALAREEVSPWPGKSVLAIFRGSEEPAKPPTSRSARRSMAIDMLVLGVSITETASSVGYTRQHLSQLVHHDPTFRVELEQRRVEAPQRRSDRLWQIHDRAASVIETALDEGNPRIAMEVFKLSSRGVTDVSDRADDSPPPQIQSTPTKSIGDAPMPVETDTNLSPGITCGDCRLVAKTEGGLKQHRKAKHGG